LDDAIDFREALGQLMAELSAPVTEVLPAPWSADGRTVRLILANGRDVAARWLAGPDAIGTASALARTAQAFAAAGIEVPWPMDVRPSPPGGAWVISPWLDGQVGAAWLDDDSRRRALVAGMAAMAARVAAVDPRGLLLPSTWADRARLASAVDEWVDRLGAAVTDSAIRDLDTIASAWSRSGSKGFWDPVVGHGDFVPVNVIVRPGGTLALLDLVDVQLAPRLFDLAWWGWVVRYHHPEAWAAGWPALLAAAGIPRDDDLDRACIAMGRLRALQQAAGTPAGDGRGRWLTRWRATADW
jgi:aminoglycoside phosphotransferase (APT) family kinase protein